MNLEGKGDEKNNTQVSEWIVRTFNEIRAQKDEQIWRSYCICGGSREDKKSRLKTSFQNFKNKNVNESIKVDEIAIQ